MKRLNSGIFLLLLLNYITYCGLASISGGRNYDIEMQTVLKGSLPKRARYYQALMDLSSLKKSDEYSALPESYVVFICLNDPFGLGEPRYTAKLQCLENSAANEKIDDKALKVYYNSKAWDKLAEKDAEVRTFLKFLNTQKAEDKLTEDIMEAVKIARLREPWRVEYMQTREKYREARAEGLAEGLAAGRAEQLAADKIIIDHVNAEVERLKARIAELEGAAK